ncbi:MAG: DUF3870 domain-containing protein [Firmicutes bacterium]|nr:DUF3870 domain-containing protein [Bacillota bacterium]
MQASKHYPEDSILLSGYAKLPANMVRASTEQVIGVAVVVDPKTSLVIDAECSLVLEIARNFLKDIMIGINLEKDFDDLISKIEKRYQGSASKAIMTALKVIYNKYLGYLKNNSPKTQ